MTHDVAELLQPEQAGNHKVDQQQETFLDNIRQSFKEKQEEGVPLTKNKLTEIINLFFRKLFTDK